MNQLSKHNLSGIVQKERPRDYLGLSGLQIDSVVSILSIAKPQMKSRGMWIKFEFRV